MTDKITIERETLQAAFDALDYLGDCSDYDVTPRAWQGAKAEQVCTALRAALAAQPAEPVAWLWRLNHSGKAFFMVADSTLREVLTDAFPVYAAPAAVPPDGMDTVAIKYAHKMALDLECILAEYGGSWYNTAMQTLGEYRSAMNAIHERESPTFMGEPVTAAGDKP